MYWLNIAFHSVHLKRQHNMLECRWFAWITIGVVEVSERKNRPVLSGRPENPVSKCQVQRVRKAINHQRVTREGESRWGGGDPTVDQRICVYVPIVCCPGSLCFAGSLHTLYFQWESVPSETPKMGAARGSVGICSSVCSIHTPTCKVMVMLYLKQGLSPFLFYFKFTSKSATNNVCRIYLWISSFCHWLGLMSLK